MTINKKPATGWHRKAGYSETSICRDSIANHVAVALWRWAYSVEEKRQECGAAGHLWKQAACCVALAFFRLAGGRI